LPILGIIGAGVATWRARGSRAMVGWAAIALFTLFAGLMLLWQVRAGPAAQMLSVPGACALVWILVPWFLRRSSLVVRVAGSLAAFVIVSGLFAGFVLPWLPNDSKGSANRDKVAQANAACARYSTLRQLDRIPRATMFTHVDLGPRLITISHHDGVAGPYHRNGRAILDVHHAFTGAPQAFRAIAAPHKAGYLLICPDMSETTLYRSRAPNGFYAQLARGQVPNWLEAVKLPPKSPFRLWKIRYDLPELQDVPDAPINGRPRMPPPPPAKP
jgi:hypothetical protein